MGCGASADAADGPAPGSGAHQYAAREKRREERRARRLAAHRAGEGNDDGFDEHDIASEAQMLYRAHSVRRKYAERCDKADAAALQHLTRSMCPSPTCASPSSAAGGSSSCPCRAKPMPAGSDGDGPLFPPSELPGQVPDAPALGAPADLASSSEAHSATASGGFTSRDSAAPMSGSTRDTAQRSSIGPLSRAFSVFELLESDDDDDGAATVDEPIRTDSFGGGYWSPQPDAHDMRGDDGGSSSWTPRPAHPAPPMLPSPGVYLPAPAAAGRPPRLPMASEGFDAGDEADDVPAAYLLSHESLTEFAEQQQRQQQQQRETAGASSLLARSASRCSLGSTMRQTPLETLQAKLETPSDLRDRQKATSPPPRRESTTDVSRSALRRKKLLR